MSKEQTDVEVGHSGFGQVEPTIAVEKESE